MIDTLPRHHRPTAPTRGGRLAPWLIVIVFLLQFLAAAEHHHDPKAKTAHCVTCTLHAQPHAPPPAAVPAAAPFSWTLLHGVAAARPLPAPAARTSHLRPPAHAPPALLPT